MKISYNWLQMYFEKKLPNPDNIIYLLTKFSFEVETLERKNNDYVFDIKISPDRTHDCLSHLGIAKEISAILNYKIQNPCPQILRIKRCRQANFKTQNKFKIDVQEPELCRRYTGRVIEGVKFSPSPKWVREKLEAIGQKSINNIVDATNFVMFEFGQPLHAFDADKVEGKIIVRKAKKGEKITTLDNQNIELNENILIIADEKSPLAIAGIKGGEKAEIDIETKNIILEAANFEPVNIRKTSQKINLRTESSLRFEAGISPDLTERAMDRLTGIILDVAGGKIISETDFYPRRANLYKLGIHSKEVSKLLGIEISKETILDIFGRLGFGVKKISPLKNILKLAKSFAGKPYKYGASVTFDAPEFFDCSSFTSYVFAHSGVQIPRLSVEQFLFGKKINEKDLKEGDLVFSKGKNSHFHKEVPDGVGHVGIYLGRGKIIHASGLSDKGKIVIEDYKKAPSFKDLRGFRRIIAEEDDLLLVTIPPERLDIRIKEDLIEEVARIYGYEKISSQLPGEILVPPRRNDNWFYAEMARNILTGAGFSEVYNYSFNQKGDMEILNPIAEDKKYLRTNLIDGLHANIKDNARYFKDIKIFEIGRIFPKSGETISLAGIASSLDFFGIKGVVDIFLKKLGINDFYYADHPDKTAGIRVRNTEIGTINYFSAQGGPAFGWEINFEMLVKISEEEMEYRPISKYPIVTRDISLFAPLTTKVDEVLDVLENIGGELLIDTDLFDIFEKGDRKSFAFHLIFQSDKKTLSEKEINDLMNKIIKALETNFNWEVRRQK